jgi:xanthine dehydrogenase YagR molybdenum-binding subunit
MRYIGKETNRVDGVAKVTGKARYAAEFQVPDMAHGCLVLSAVARGTIRSIDTAEAEALPGVVRVFTHRKHSQTGLDRSGRRHGPDSAGNFSRAP